MRNLSPHQNKYKFITVLAIPLFCLAVFVFPKYCQAESHLLINEIMTGKSSASQDEFIELYNSTDKDIALDNYKLTKKTKTGTESNLISSSKFSGKILSHGYFLIAPPDYKDSYSADLAYSGSSYSIASDNTVILYDKTNDIVDEVGYGEAQDFEKKAAPNPSSGKSIERNNFSDTDNNFEDFSIRNVPSPQNSLYKKEEDTKDEPIKTVIYDIKFNEVFPYPASSDKEFVELINNEKDKIDISQWEIKDAAGHNLTIPDKTYIKSGEIIYFEGNFYLNNSNLETIYILDDKENQVDTISYDDAKEDYSYSSNGTAWQWTSLKTPGKTNEFDTKTAMDLKIKKDNEIYKNIYAAFEIKYADANDSTKYTWNFGDGHKSYLQKTRHKYEESGNYSASIKVTDGKNSETINFMVGVKDYSAPKIKIIQVVPNPKGNDSKEYIVLENKSKNKINLKNWSVATGWKSLVNHPIKDNFIIKPGKSKKLTKKICALTLNNAQSKIELRYPDGEVAQKLKYNRKKNKLVEDEIMEKSGKNWTWNKPPSNPAENQDETENNGSEHPIEDAAPKEDSGELNGSEIKQDTEIKIDESEMQANLGKYSENPAFAAKKQNRIQLISYATKVNTPTSFLDAPGKVAGAYTEKVNIPEKSWIERIANWLWINTNSNINLLLNKL